MRLLLYSGLLLLGFVGLALTVAVWQQSRRIRSRHRRTLADALEPRSTFPTIAVAPTQHLRTTLAPEEFRVEWVGLPEGLSGILGVTEREIVLDSSRYESLFHIPLARVFEATLIGRYDAIESSPQASLLRLSWLRGGERIQSVFQIAGNRIAAERLRREIHLRAGLGERPTMPAPP